MRCGSSAATSAGGGVSVAAAVVRLAGIGGVAVVSLAAIVRLSAIVVAAVERRSAIGVAAVERLAAMVVAAVVGRAAKAVAPEATIEVAETVALAGVSKGETARGLSEDEAGAGVDERPKPPRWPKPG